MCWLEPVIAVRIAVRCARGDQKIREGRVVYRDETAKGSLGAKVDGLMPRLTEDLKELMAIPSVSAPTAFTHRG